MHVNYTLNIVDLICMISNCSQHAMQSITGYRVSVFDLNEKKKEFQKIFKGIVILSSIRRVKISFRNDFSLLF